MHAGKEELQACKRGFIGVDVEMDKGKLLPRNRTGSFGKNTFMVEHGGKFREITLDFLERSRVLAFVKEWAVYFSHSREPRESIEKV